MNTLNRLAIGVVATTAAVVPVLVVAPAAQARSFHWTVIESALDGKQDACKVLIRHGRAWKIYNRVDNRPSDHGRLKGTMTVTVNGAQTSRHWASAWVQPGHVSGVGSVIMPRKPGRGLVMTLSGDQAGSGGTLRPAALHHC